MSRILRGIAMVVALLAGLSPALADTRWRLVASHPHDKSAFTEGLVLHDGHLYESTGLVGESEIREVRLRDGAVLRRVSVHPPYFGEGIAWWDNHLVSLTWRHGQGFLWSLPDLRQQGSFAYAGEGWGMTSDGRQLIMSDGTQALRFLDPRTLQETRRINVTWQGAPVTLLNELEYVHGEIFANVWMTTQIVRIDPSDGHVIDWIDLSSLVNRTPVADRGDDVLNGIAWDARRNRLLVTGKRWPRLYEIAVQF